MITTKRCFVASVCIAGLAIGFIWLTSSGETVTFDVVDRKSGQPVPDAFAAVSERWTNLPVEKLNIRGLQRSRRRTIHGKNGHIRVHGLPKNPDYHFRVTLLSQTHYQAIFTRTDCDRINYPSDDRSIEELQTRSKLITIALEPVAFPSSQSR